MYLLKVLIKYCFITALFLSFSLTSYAQNWQPWGANDFDKLSYYNAEHVTIAFNNETPYVAFNDYLKNSAITVKKLKEDKSGWELVGNAGFSGAAGDARDISLVFNGNTPYVAYQHSNTNNRGFVKKFNGTSWETVGSGPFSAAKAEDINLVFSQDNTPYLAFRDNGTVTLKKFDGTDWILVGTAGFISGTYLSLAFNENIPYLSFRDNNTSFAATVVKFNDGIWETVGSTGFSLSEESGQRQVVYTSIAFDDTMPFVAYTDVYDKVTVKKFTGLAWETVGSAAFSTGKAYDVSLVIHANVPYVLYRDGGTGNGSRATVKKFNGVNWETVGSEGFSHNSAYEPSLAFNNNIPYVAYGGAGNSKYEAAVMKLNDAGTSWEGVGEITSLNNLPSTAQFYFDGAVPYVYYTDNKLEGKATVKKFNGTIWETIGIEGFTAGGANKISFHFNNGAPYAIYRDDSNGLKVTVMKFNGTSWEAVGSAVSGSTSNYFSLFFDNGGIPYVAYKDGSTTNTILKKFTGSSWQTIGSPFPTGSLNDFNLFFDGDTHYAAHADYNQGSKATVKKLNGSTWETLGTAGFTAGQVQQISISVIAGTPYVAFRDGGQSWKATVMKFNGSTWELVGSRGFVIVDNPKLIYNHSTLYLHYNQGLRKFNGTDWERVGNKSTISTGYDLLFKGATPYIAYKDAPAVDRATVQKLNNTGTAWETIGSAAFSAGTANNIALSMVENKLYVTYSSYQGGAYLKVFEEEALPVTLTAFKATAEYNSAKLTWETASESNNKEFIIYRSGNDKVFKQIGTVAGAGNSSSKKSYTFYDKNPLNGSNYYKLVQIDLDGEVTELGIKSLSLGLSASTLTIYPNPSTDKITVSFEEDKYHSLSLTGIDGKVLQTIGLKPDQENIEIDLRKYAQGIYLVKLISNGYHHVKKVIKL